MPSEDLAAGILPQVGIFRVRPYSWQCTGFVPIMPPWGQQGVVQMPPQSDLRQMPLDDC